MVKIKNQYLGIIRKLINPIHYLKGGEGQKIQKWVLITLYIIIIIIFIYILVIFIKYLLYPNCNDGRLNCTDSWGCLLLSEVKSGKKPYSLLKSTIPSSSKGIGYSLGIWLYVKSKNFNNELQKFKTVLVRSISKKYDNFNDNQYSVQPGIWLYGNTNKILLRWDTMGRLSNVIKCSKMRQPCSLKSRCRNDDDTIKICISKGNKNILAKEHVSIHSMNPYINPPNKLCSSIKTGGGELWNTSDSNTDNETCIDNVPLDRWFHLCIVMQEQSVDIYVDGKLYSTLTLNSLPNNKDDSELHLSQDSSPYYKNLNGFSGSMSQLRFFNYSLTPKDVLRIYSWGPYPYVFDRTLTCKQDKFSKTKNKNKASAQNLLGSDNY